MSAFIYPEPGDEQTVARKLLALADSPYEVQTSTDDGLSFRVPEALADRYRQSLLGSAAPQPTETTAPAKKTTARRRTRKEGT